MKPSLVSKVFLSAILGTAAAHAAPAAKSDPMEGRRANAAALFQQGIDAVQAGRTEEGCDKLAESVSIMPDSGAMGALAECDTALGRMGEAWELWRDLATSAPTAELRDDATKNAAALDARLARVTVHLRGAAPSSVVVTLNGKPVRALDATAHRVVPGKLVVAASSPEIEPWTQTFTTRQGATLEVEIPVVESQDSIRHRGHARLIGLSLVGIGAVGLGVGAVYGSRAYADWRSATASCGGDVDRCKSAGYAAAQSKLASARRAATISSSSISLGLGAAAAGVVVYFVFRGPPREESRVAWRAMPMVSSQALGVALSRSLP